MATPVRMPALGQTSDQLRLIAWLKSEGDTVTEGEPLFEAESDKAVHEVEASCDGTVLRVVGDVDAVIAAGSVIAWIGAPGDEIPQDAPAASAQPAARIAATPVARRVAREQGVDLATVVGSGPNGRIESRDVLAAAQSTTGEESAPGEHTGPGGGAAELPAGVHEEAVPRHRQVIAERLLRSTAIPQFSVSRTVDARKALQRAGAVEGATLTHLILQAMSAALEEFPRVNRIWVDAGPRFRQFTQAKVGLAIASDERLVVATVNEAHRLALPELALAVRETVRQGREGRLSGPATSAAPISLSNLGMYGVDHFEALVDPDQTAILAVGRVLDGPAVIDGQLVVIPQFALTLTVDHRTVDGAEAGSYLAAVCDHLEH